MAPDSPARGASVAPNRRALCEIAVRVSEKVPRREWQKGRATIRPPVCSRDGRRARGKSSENCCWRDHPCYARERRATASSASHRGAPIARPRPRPLSRSEVSRARAWDHRTRGPTVARAAGRGEASREEASRARGGSAREGARDPACFSTSTWTSTSSWSRGTSGRTCARCSRRSSATRYARGTAKSVALRLSSVARPPPRGFGPRPPARRERDPPRRSIDVTLGVSTPTRPAGAPLAEGNVPEPRSESGLAQPPLTSRSRRNPLSPLSRRWRAAARVATGSSS